MDIDYPHDTRLTMLRLVAKQFGHTLALPETALHEYVSFRRASLANKILAATSAVGELLGTLDSWPGRSQWESLPEPNLTDLAEEVEHSLRRSFEILPLTEEILREAVIRDIYREGPGDAADRASVIRDAAMWLIVKSTCVASGTMPVLLVGAANDFGRRFLRAYSVSEKPENLVYCSGIEHAVAELAGPAETDHILESGLIQNSDSMVQWSTTDDEISLGSASLACQVVASSSLHLGDYGSEVRPRPRIAQESWMNGSV